MRLELLHHIPTGTPRKTPILFVHGAWHAAWCWQPHFLAYFAAHGYDAYAMSLRGHGVSEGREQLRWTRLSQYVADVAQIVDMLPAPPILVGHSLGALIVQRFLETRSVPAAILLAPLPVRGSLLFTLRLLAREPLAMLRAVVTLSLYPVVDKPSKYKRWFLANDVSNEEATRYAARLQDESFRMIWECAYAGLPNVSRIRAHGVPMLVVGGAEDRVFTPPEVEETARAYNAPLRMFPDMPHMLMLDSRWQQPADAMLAWLKGR